MIPEISIVKLFLDYPLWQKYGDLLKVNDFPKELQPLVRLLYAKYENKEQTDPNLSVSDLANVFFAGNPSNREYMEGVFTQIEKDTSQESTVLELIQGIRTRTLLQELSMKAYDASQGKEKLEAVTEFFERLKKSEKEVEEEDFSFVSDDLEFLINEAVMIPGLRFRMKTLESMLGSLRKGNFGFIFARPETGKTTFLASEVTYMAGQTDRPILWFNNEQEGKQVSLRCYQSALGLDLVNLQRGLKEHRDKFHEITKGNIKIFDSAQIHYKTVEKACARFNPSLIIFDQIDKIVGHQNDREDLRLGAIYQWARELAKQYAPTIGVCQADGTGEGQKWLTMANVANAKTSKQAEADFIIGIGKVNDAGYDAIRYLHASKNKLLDSMIDETLRHGRREVIIEPTIGRYRDIG